MEKAADATQAPSDAGEQRNSWRRALDVLFSLSTEMLTENWAFLHTHTHTAGS